MFILPFVAPLATNGNRKHCSINFDPRSSIVRSVFDSRLSGVVLWFKYKQDRGQTSVEPLGHARILDSIVSIMNCLKLKIA